MQKSIVEYIGNKTNCMFIKNIKDITTQISNEEII